MNVVLAVLFFGSAFAQLDPDLFDKSMFSPSDKEWFYEIYDKCIEKLEIDKERADAEQLEDYEFEEFAECALDLAEAIDEAGEVKYWQIFQYVPNGYLGVWADMFENYCLVIEEPRCADVVFHVFKRE